MFGILFNFNLERIYHTWMYQISICLWLETCTFGLKKTFKKKRLPFEYEYENLQKPNISAIHGSLLPITGFLAEPTTQNSLRVAKGVNEAPVILDSAPENRNDSFEHCRDILPCQLLVGKSLVDGWIRVGSLANQQKKSGERSHLWRFPWNKANRCACPMAHEFYFM